MTLGQLKTATDSLASKPDRGPAYSMAVQQLTKAAEKIDIDPGSLARPLKPKRALTVNIRRQDRRRRCASVYWAPRSAQRFGGPAKAIRSIYT